MDELVEWLRAQLEIDEEIARAAAHYEAGNWTTKGGHPVSVADELVEQADTFERVVVFDEGSPSEEQAHHIAEHDPARVLREIDAKRQVLAEYEQAARYATTTWGQSNADQSRARTLGKVMRLLALPYADRPGYKESWRP